MLLVVPFLPSLIPNPSPLVYDKEWEKGALLAAISDGGGIRGGLVMREGRKGPGWQICPLSPLGEGQGERS